MELITTDVPVPMSLMIVGSSNPDINLEILGHGCSREKQKCNYEYTNTDLYELNDAPSSRNHQYGVVPTLNSELWMNWRELLVSFNNLVKQCNQAKKKRWKYIIYNKITNDLKFEYYTQLSVNSCYKYFI